MTKQSSVRNRASISSRFAPLLRTETQNTSASRLRANSNISIDGDEDHSIEHPVEPRATTATLPPVMVSSHLERLTRNNNKLTHIVETN